jgi:hypothetical protein
MSDNDYRRKTKMINSLEIIEIIKEYLKDVNGDLDSVRMFGLNNRMMVRYSAQKEILENLLDYIDFRIKEDENEKIVKHTDPDQYPIFKEDMK